MRSPPSDLLRSEAYPSWFPVKVGGTGVAQFRAAVGPLLVPLLSTSGVSILVSSSHTHATPLL